MSSKTVRTKPKKLASGTTARAVKEWVGATPDTEAPPRVQLRILERQGGKCALTGQKFRVGDKKRLDHILAVADGGKNQESNLWWIIDIEHKIKTKAEAAARKKVRARAKTHAGIRRQPAKPLKSRNDLPTAPTKSAITGKKKIAKLPLPRGPTELERRYGIAPKKGER